MRRAEIWTVSGGPDYLGKPRPAVIVQDDAYAATRSVTIIAFTTRPAEIPMLRLAFEPTPANGLGNPSYVMIDKVATVPRSKLGRKVGFLSDEDMLRINQALGTFLGLTHALEPAELRNIP